MYSSLLFKLVVITELFSVVN